MWHIGTRDIDTENLTLRTYDLGDTASLYRNWAAYPESFRYLRLEPLTDVKAVREFIGRTIYTYKNPDSYHWIVVEPSAGEAVGIGELSVVSELDETGTFTLSIGKPYWGKGYATEVLSALLAYGFGEVGFNRIEAYHSIGNPVSGTVMKKCGMRHEGQSRQKYKNNGGYEDCDLYAMLKEDFEALQK